MIAAAGSLSLLALFAFPASFRAQGGPTPIPPRQADLPVIITEQSPLTAGNGEIMVVVQLAEPPAAAALGALGKGVFAPFEDALARLATRMVLARQKAVIAVLVAAPIGAQVLDTQGMLVNTITVRVNAAAVEAIRRIPGVVGITVVSTAAPDVVRPDSSAVSPSQTDVILPQGDVH